MGVTIHNSLYYPMLVQFKIHVHVQYYHSEVHIEFHITVHNDSFKISPSYSLPHPQVLYVKIRDQYKNTTLTTLHSFVDIPQIRRYVENRSQKQNKIKNKKNLNPIHA